MENIGPFFVDSIFLYFNKDCSIKFRSKNSTVLVLCLLRNLMEQSLCSEKNLMGMVWANLQGLCQLKVKHKHQNKTSYWVGNAPNCL